MSSCTWKNELTVERKLKKENQFENETFHFTGNGKAQENYFVIENLCLEHRNILGLMFYLYPFLGTKIRCRRLILVQWDCLLRADLRKLKFCKNVRARSCELRDMDVQISKSYFFLFFFSRSLKLDLDRWFVELEVQPNWAEENFPFFKLSEIQRKLTLMFFFSI